MCCSPLPPGNASLFVCCPCDTAAQGFLSQHNKVPSSPAAPSITLTANSPVVQQGDWKSPWSLGEVLNSLSSALLLPSLKLLPMNKYQGFGSRASKYFVFQDLLNIEVLVRSHCHVMAWTVQHLFPILHFSLIFCVALNKPLTSYINFLILHFRLISICKEQRW